MASYQMFRLVPMRDEAVSEQDEWTGLDDAKEKRKRQNRLNQRAARRRQRLNDAQAQEKDAQPAQHTDRTHLSHYSTPEASDIYSSPSVSVSSSASSRAVYFPLTPDHQLLHVVSFNVSRAVLTNYFIVASIPNPVSGFCSIRRVFKLPSPQEMASWLEPRVEQGAASLILPPALMPTQVQKRVPHFGWIDLFPSPQLRDNLIMAFEQSGIDEDVLMMDLVGTALANLCAGGDKGCESEPQLDHNTSDDQHQGSATMPDSPGDKSSTPVAWSEEPGIVSWSDPWDVSGWEFTENFARKWGFLLRGCPDVLAAANKWRELRGEDPLVVAM